jgi:SAM-dependent methyltransferase
MQRLRQAWRATVNGLRLGRLDDDALRALDERYYATTDLYVTDEWNERGLMDWEQSAVAELFAPGARLLVVGCGGGREVLALLRAGYDATGAESHPDLSAYAADLLARHGYAGRIEPVGRDEVPAGPACDGLIVGWGAYSLIHGRGARTTFLTAARGRVRAGGSVLVSCFGHDAPGRELALTARLANGLRRVRGRAAVEVGDTLVPNRARIFTREELADEARAGGLELTYWQLLGIADGATRYTVAALRAP